MIDIEKRLRRTFSSMAGNETLTDALGEDAAADMLKWGEAIAESVVRKTSQMEDDVAEEFLAPHLKALRLMMRAIGQWFNEKDPIVSSDLWTRIVQNGKILFGDGFALPPMDEVRAQIEPDVNTQQMVAELRTLFDSLGSKG